jgi:hypothetical protein
MIIAASEVITASGNLLIELPGWSPRFGSAD